MRSDNEAIKQNAVRRAVSDADDRGIGRFDEN